MPAKKPARKSGNVRFHPEQKVRDINGILAEKRFMRRFGEKYLELQGNYLRTIAKLSRKRAKGPLTGAERSELADAYRNMRALQKKLKQRYMSRARQTSAKAERDPKFGVFLTDKYFRELFRVRAKRHAKSALAFIDIDHLKAINDKYGHKAGDIVIRALGNALSKAVEKNQGIVGRHGGEEILVWAPVNVKELSELLKKASIETNKAVRKEMKKAGINFVNKATYSAGIVPVEGSYVRSEEFNKVYGHVVQAADKLLYRSKRSGRNAYTVKAGKELITKRLLSP